jgi:hypothetical protein
MSDSTSREREIFERKFRVRYLLLTLGIFLPLVWAFVGMKNVYPVASWTVMMGSGHLQRGHHYFLLRGETVSGEMVDIPAIELTDALSARNWGLVSATMANSSFKLHSLHPANAGLLGAAGSFEKLPPASRVPELLEAWGKIYNSRLPEASPQRLKAIRLDAYHWPGQQYSNYDQFIKSWREEL